MPPLNTRDRRGNPAGNQNYGITRLWETHHQIARLLVLGWKATQIAAHLGCTPQTVSNARNNPEVKRQIELLGARADEGTISVTQKIQDLAPRCVDVMEEVMELESDATNRRLAAKELLEMAGYKAVTKIATTNAFLTLADIEQIKERARLAGFVKSDSAEEVPFEEVSDAN